MTSIDKLDSQPDDSVGSDSVASDSVGSDSVASDSVASDPEQPTQPETAADTETQDPETQDPETQDPETQDPETQDPETHIRVAVAAALDRKAERLLVLDLDAISDFTARFLICSGTNERQVQAIADTVIKQLRAAGLRPLHAEGQRHGRWILLDYGGAMVIHIFLDETREFYDLERLWSDAPDITSRFVP